MHNHNVRVKGFKVKVGGEAPEDPTTIHISPESNPGLSVEIPGSMDIQPTGKMDLLVWRDGEQLFVPISPA